MDPFLRCDHSNEILTIVLAHGSVCFAAYFKLKFSYILIWSSFEKSRARGGRKEEGVVCIQIMHRRGFVSSRKTAIRWKRRDADIKRKQRVNETIETITLIQFFKFVWYKSDEQQTAAKTAKCKVSI